MAASAVALPSRRLQVAGDGVVVAEDRRGGADLGPHVADRGLSGGRHRVGARPEVLDDGTGPALHREDLGDFEDHVLRRRPARQLTGEVHADEFGPTNVPGESGHHVDRIGAADADGDHAEAAGVRCVGVGADHHPTGKGVVFENDLVDDAGPGLPESAAVLGADRFEEVVHLGVAVDGGHQIELAIDPGLDEVITMGGGGNGDLGEARCHELQPGHLGGGVLHRNPDRAGSRCT